MPRIATFNVNGVNGRLPVLLKWLTETDADIICLQELKTSDEKFPAEAIEKAGYGAIWHGQKSYNGEAILTQLAEKSHWNGDAGCPEIRTIHTLHRGRGRRAYRRLPLPAQRQSRTGSEIRLQAEMVRAFDRLQ